MSVRPSVRHTRVGFLGNLISGLNLNKIVLGTWNYAIKKTIQRWGGEQLARTHLVSDLCQNCVSALEIFCRRHHSTTLSIVHHSLTSWIICGWRLWWSFSWLYLDLARLVSLGPTQCLGRLLKSDSIKSTLWQYYKKNMFSFISYFELLKLEKCDY